MRLSFDEARRELDAFVREHAPAHYATPAAPSTFEELQAWYAQWRDMAHAYGTPFMLPVSSEHCENTIYLTPEGNHAFRAWHDETHLRTERGFTPEDELRVACTHQREAIVLGLSLDARWLLWCDTAKQTEFQRDTGEFPANQLEFCRFHYERPPRRRVYVRT